MHRFSIGRVLKMTFGGALGGLITWLIINPSYQQIEEQGATHSISDVYAHAVTIGALIGVAIGLALILSEELQTPNASRLANIGLRGAAAGLLGGLVGALCGQIVFSILMALVAVASILMGEVARTLLVFSRTIGWALMGAGAGICPGMAAKSSKRIRQGILGGILGGGIGGFLFDGLASVYQSGSVSRAVGFVCMGAAIGAAVSLVEEAGKDAWLTILTGAKEGRSYILSKDQTTIGRNEMADIPLFGDSNVQSIHATVTKSTGVVSVASASGISINSQTVSSAFLSNGDILSIGKHKLRFNTTLRTHVAQSPIPPQQSYLTSPKELLMSQPPQTTQTQKPATILQSVMGPHTGLQFPLVPGGVPVTIGRDPNCDIALPNDGMVSRRHAVLFWDGSNWRVEDAGSTNGVYVNGVRVTSRILNAGTDSIGIGQSVFTVQ